MTGIWWLLTLVSLIHLIPVAICFPLVLAYTCFLCQCLPYVVDSLRQMRPSTRNERATAGAHLSTVATLEALRFLAANVLVSSRCFAWGLTSGLQ